MIKVMLVDDEDLIREGLHDSVAWERLGMEVAGQAENGEQALRLFREIRPDIVVTDIKMPFLNGLELLERIKAEDPNPYFIILSGYEDFHFAQRAVKIGAFDYVLKPVELEYLEELLFKIKVEYESRAARRQEEQTIKDKLTRNLPLLRETFFKDLLFRNIPDGLLEEKAADLGLNSRLRCCQAILVQLDDVPEPLDADAGGSDDSSRFLQILKDAANGADEAFPVEMRRNELVLCVADEHELRLLTRVRTLCQSIRSELAIRLNRTATFSLGKVHLGLGKIAQSYEEALEAMEYKFVLGGSQTIRYEEIGEKLEPYSLILDDSERIRSIDFSDKASIEQNVKELMANLKTAGRNSYLYTQMIVSGIYILAIEKLKECGGTLQEIHDGPIHDYKEIAAYQTLEAVTDKLIAILFNIADYLDGRKQGRFASLVDRAKIHMKLHYADSAYSLEDAARHVNLSSSYFSLVFRQETGQNFIDCLTSIRIEKAMRLLESTGLRTYEISDRVGYNNATYFSTIFKRYTGHSPSEYRKRESAPGATGGNAPAGNSS